MSCHLNHTAERFIFFCCENTSPLRLLPTVKEGVQRFQPAFYVLLLRPLFTHMRLAQLLNPYRSKIRLSTRAQVIIFKNKMLCSIERPEIVLFLSNQSPSETIGERGSLPLLC